MSLSFCLPVCVFRVSDESVGLRRILSHSTESLNFRSRTLSMESLTDEGPSVCTASSPPSAPSFALPEVT